MEPVLPAEDETSNCLLRHVGNYLYYQPLAAEMRQNCFNGSWRNIPALPVAVPSMAGMGSAFEERKVDFGVAGEGGRGCSASLALKQKDL